MDCDSFFGLLNIRLRQLFRRLYDSMKQHEYPARVGEVKNPQSRLAETGF
jgi:hypothetical protein